MLNIWPGSSPPKKLLRIFTRLHWECILWLCWTFVHLRGNKKAWESPRTGRDTGQPAWLHTQHLASLPSSPELDSFYDFINCPESTHLFKLLSWFPLIWRFMNQYLPNKQAPSLPIICQSDHLSKSSLTVTPLSITNKYNAKNQYKDHTGCFFSLVPPESTLT